MTETQQHINNLVNNCLYFASRNGKLIGGHSNSVSKSQSRKYEKDGLAINFRVYASGFSNGSCSVKVTEKDSVVLEADGNFTAYAHGMIAKTYVPGDWETKIPEWKK